MRSLLYRPRIKQTITVEPAESPSQASAQQQQAGPISLLCDAMFLLVAIGFALLLSGLFSSFWPATVPDAERAIVHFTTSTLLIFGWAAFILLDLSRYLGHPQRLPFAYPHRVTRAIYAQRLEVWLSLLAFNLLLFSLCSVLPGVAIASKLFLAAILALSVFAIRKSIPARRLAVAASVGMFFLAMLLVQVGGYLIPAPEEVPDETTEEDAEAMRSQPRFFS